MLEMLLTGLAPRLLDKGLQAWASSKETVSVKALARESLERELRLNREILDEIQKAKTNKLKETAAALASLLTTAAFDRLVNLGVPLTIMFDDPLPERLWEDIKLNGHERNCTAGLNTSVFLLEKTYHRMKIFKLRSSAGIDRSKLGYLSKLVWGMLKTLESSR